MSQDSRTIKQYYLQHDTLLCKRHQISFDNQNVKVRKRVTMSFDVLTGQNQSTFYIEDIGINQHIGINQLV